MNKLILALIATVILSGCSVTTEQITAAQKACEPHGGLNYVRSQSSEYFDAYCNNGANIFARNEEVLSK